MFLQPVSQRTKLLINLKQIGTQRAQHRCKYEAKKGLELNGYLFNASCNFACFSVYLFLSPFLLGRVPVRGPKGRLWRAFRLCINRNVY